jgi:hypothetical protein
MKLIFMFRNITRTTRKLFCNPKTVPSHQTLFDKIIIPYIGIENIIAIIPLEVAPYPSQL